MQDKGLTPSQTVGPYFKYGLTPNGAYQWNDAFTNNLVTPDTSGDRIRVEGRVFDGDGAPVPDCMLEIWQADAQGRFSDPQDSRALKNSSFKGGCTSSGPAVAAKARNQSSGRSEISVAGRRSMTSTTTSPSEISRSRFTGLEPPSTELEHHERQAHEKADDDSVRRCRAHTDQVGLVRGGWFGQGHAACSRRSVVGQRPRGTSGPLRRADKNW